MKYNKLVRDKIPEVIRSKGGTPVIRVAGRDEYWQKLKEKLDEEIKEFQEAENIEELADIAEVLDAIIVYKKFSRRRLQTVKDKKAAERGKFKKMIILEEA